MRSVAAAAVVAVVLVLGAVGYGIYVDNTAKLLSDYTEAIESAVLQEDFDSVKRQAQELMSVVDKKKEILGAIADHEEIYEIQRILAKLICYAEQSDTSEMYATCAEVQMLINRLSGNSSPAIFNIL